MGAPQARLSDLANGLKERGFDVKVLTALPSYPTGKLFKGYKGLFMKEQIAGVEVLRTWVYPSHKIHFIPRLLSYFSFVFSSLLLGFWKIGRFDFLLTESPPLFLGISGYLLSRAKRAKWIFNVSDLWPESVVRLGLLNDGFFLRSARKLEAFCYKKAWLVTGQSREILNDINARFPGVPTYHLSNGVDVDIFSPEKYDIHVREKLSPQGEKVVLYAGLHGLAQGLDQVLQAACSFSQGVRFVFIGDGPEKQRLIRLSQEMGLTNVLFMDILPKEQVPAYVASADICVIPLKAVIPGAVPSKIYEAMASSKPILLIAEGEARKIVEGHHSGLVVSPGDVEGVKQALNSLISSSSLRKQMGDNGRTSAMEHFARGSIVSAFYDYLLKGNLSE